MRVRTYKFNDPGSGVYEFIHHQGSYGHLYEMISTPSNLVYNETLNPSIPFEQWVHQNIAHVLDIEDNR